MPYHIVEPATARVDADMVARLTAELSNVPDRTAAGAFSVRGPVSVPEIVEEATPRGPLHVTVVWDLWAHLSGEERGRVILEAYRQAFGEDKMRLISIPMGVTSGEARRLRIFDPRPSDFPE